MRPLTPVLPQRPANRRLRVILLGALVLLMAASCLGPWLFATRSQPVASAVEAIESDPRVAAALGAPVSVSLAVSRRMSRSVIDSLRGQDRISVRTTVRGSQRNGELTLSAQNLDQQGWAGSFQVEAPARQVLRNGAYVTEGGGAILSGTFAPDGTARVAGAPPAAP